jgi:hypothetical protein
VRAKLQQQYLEQFVPNQLLHQQLCSAEARVYQQLSGGVLHCRCPDCSNFTQHMPVRSSSHEQDGDRVQQSAPLSCYTVYLCTQLAIHELRMQPWRCAECGYAHRVGPLQLGCLPGTANAFTMQQTGMPLIWFSMDLLQHLDRAVFVEGDQSIYKYVEARQAGWLSNRHVMGLQPHDDGSISLPELPDSYKVQQPPVSADTIRRQLGDALREYGRIRTKVETLSEQLPGYPSKAGVPCPACLPGKAQISVDLCFKLEQVKRPGFTLDDEGAADQRRVVSHKATTDALAQIDCDMQQQQQQQQGLVPAAVAALKQIPARVPDLSARSSATGGGRDVAGLEAATGSGSGSGGLGSSSAAPAADATGVDATCPAAAGGSAEESAEGACMETCSRFTADALTASVPKGVSVAADGISPHVCSPGADEWAGRLLSAYIDACVHAHAPTCSLFAYTYDLIQTLSCLVAKCLLAVLTPQLQLQLQSKTREASTARDGS